MGNWSLRQKLLMTFVSLTVMTVLVTGVSLYELSAMRDDFMHAQGGPAATKDAGQTTAAKATDERFSAALSVDLALSILAIGLAVGLAWLVTRSTMRQLGGDPAYAKEVVSRMSSGDFSRPVEVADGDRSSLLATMANMQNELGRVIADVRQAAQAIASASSQIAQGNLDLSGRTEQQASSLEETAAAMEELASTVGHNAENARQANQLANSASAVAETGGKTVQQVVSTMTDIAGSSTRIQEIIGVIDGIAFQTNILALNAAVEAARAGEQGRGFAVVAAEVRTLAQRSAEAAKEIKVLITESVTKVDSGAALVHNAGAQMEQIVTAVARVTDIVGEIASASAEQSSGINQVNQAVTQMDQSTQQNAALVEEASAASTNLEEQAKRLVSAVAGFVLAGGSKGRRAAGWDGATERRGPARATNVKRIFSHDGKALQAKPAAETKAPQRKAATAHAQSEPRAQQVRAEGDAQKQSNSKDEWETF
jgi:methyl-accepting chemotaxis protein